MEYEGSTVGVGSLETDYQLVSSLVPTYRCHQDVLHLLFGTFRLQFSHIFPCLLPSEYLLDHQSCVCLRYFALIEDHFVSDGLLCEGIGLFRFMW